MADSRRLVDKLWSYCNVLRDDGVGVIEYTEQLTYLLFLKMAHERSTRKLNPQQIMPDLYSWQRLLDADGMELEKVYTEIRNGLGRATGTRGTSTCTMRSTNDSPLWRWGSQSSGRVEAWRSDARITPR